MGMMMMMMGTKLAALMSMKTILAFIIAKKALLIGKIALLLSGFMFFRKFMGGKMSGQTGLFGNPGSTLGGGTLGGSYAPSNTGAWQGTGGWNAGGGAGGYDRRSYDAQDLAYNGYSTTTE